MAQINLDDYEPVADRIARFYGKCPEGRITSRIVSADGDPGRTRWVVEARVYRDSTPGREPDATGFAFETDGVGMAQKTAALETCETSAIGRALANLNFASSRQRASRQEMEKVAVADLTGRAATAPDMAALAALDREARERGLIDRIAPALYSRRAELEQADAAPARSAEDISRDVDTAATEDDLDALRTLWKEARAAGHAEVLERIKAAVAEIEKGGEAA